MKTSAMPVTYYLLGLFALAATAPAAWAIQQGPLTAAALRRPEGRLALGSQQLGRCQVRITPVGNSTTRVVLELSQHEPTARVYLDQNERPSSNALKANEAYVGTDSPNSRIFCGYNSGQAYRIRSRAEFSATDVTLKVGYWCGPMTEAGLGSHIDTYRCQF